MKKIKGAILFLFSVLLMVSCGKNQKKEETMGYKPIYASSEDLTNVTFTSNEQLENPGKIFVYENYLLVNDIAKGIHIYDISEIQHPIEMSFIAIEGNMGFSVKNNMLYADNVLDMIVIDISQPEAPVFTSRIPDVFPVMQSPEKHGAYECIDRSKGPVVGWERTKIKHPVCYN